MELILHFMRERGKTGQTGRLFPRSALQCGADLVIQSVHKTLPSLTQTAVLHLKEGITDRERLEFYLRIYQSSSPSYVMMASIDNCIEYMAGRGENGWNSWEGGWNTGWRTQNSGAALGFWTIMFWEKTGLLTEIFPSWLWESARRQKRRDKWNCLAEAVRRRFHLEPEMCCDRYVLYMTSLMDSEESLFKLSAALTKIDEEIAGALCMGRNEGTEGTSEETEKYSGKQGTLTWTRDVPRRISMAEA